VPVERAVEILQTDAAAGQLDSELVKILAENKSYRHGATKPPEL
jgi:hypothetical protein